jgi:hypothetical protein
MKNSTIMAVISGVCFLLSFLTFYNETYDRTYFFLQMFFLANYYVIKTIEDKK